MSIKGSTVTLKKGTSSGGTQIAAGRTIGAQFTAGEVDVTSQDDINNFRQLLPAAGTKSGTITFAAVAKDVASHAALVTDWNAGTVDAYGLTLGSLYTVDGNWKITNLEFNAEFNAELGLTLTLASGGDLSFAAVA